jgi:hypothetical protein
MAWGRCDDGFYRHDKVAELDEEMRKGCVALFWLAISWCNDRLTDGRIPPGTLRILGAHVAEAEELVRVGLWDTDAPGWQVHDFLNYNRSRAQVEQDRIQRTLAGKAGATKRWHSDSDSLNGSHGESPSEMHGDDDGRTDSEPLSEMDAPSPVPRTPVVPGPALSAREKYPNLTTDAIAALERLTGRSWSRAGQRQLDEFDELVGDHGLPAVVAAMEQAGGGKALTARQLVWPAMKALEPFPDPKAVQQAVNGAAESQAVRRRVRRTHEELYRTTGRWDPAWGDPPSGAVA